jgi:ATP-binding cassette subfamily B protein
VNASEAAGSSAPRALPHGGFTTLRDAMRLYWSSTDRYARRLILLALVVVVAGAIFTALTPIALKLAVDALMRNEVSGATLLSPVPLVALYVAGQYIGRCSTELRTALHGYAEQRVRRRIGLRLFEHVIRLPMRFHMERKTGAIGQAAEQGLRGYDLLLTHLVFTVIPVAIEFTTVVAVMIHFQHSRYLIIFAVAATTYVFAFHRWAKTIHQPAEAINTSVIHASAVLSDTLLNAETVKYFNAEHVVTRHYDEALISTESAWRGFFRSYAVNGVIIASIFATSLGASLFLGTRDVLRGAMTVGDFVLINAYVTRLVQPLELLGIAVRDIAQSAAFLGGLLALFRERTERDDAYSGSVAHPTRGELTFENISFSYRKDRPVLRDVSLRLQAGKTIAVVGVSGSGKSSLVRLLFRLYEPDKGRIFLDGVPIASMKLSALRRAIAIVPQDTVLLNRSIESNLAIGRPGCSRAEIEEAARVADLHDFIMSLPEEYETVVGERGLKLSGGERQRIAIARAALKRPRIAVFDEATSSLDSRTEREILRNLANLSSQCTTLVIAHRLSTVVYADEIVVLHHGEIVERGTHEQLLNHMGHYAMLWLAQRGSSEPSDASVA